MTRGEKCARGGRDRGAVRYESFCFCNHSHRAFGPLSATLCFFVIFDLKIARFCVVEKSIDFEVENDKTKGSDATRSFSTISSRSDILSLSET